LYSIPPDAVIRCYPHQTQLPRLNTNYIHPCRDHRLEPTQQKIDIAKCHFIASIHCLPLQKRINILHSCFPMVRTHHCSAPYYDHQCGRPREVHFHRSWILIYFCTIIIVARVSVIILIASVARVLHLFKNYMATCDSE
jgi:hypothetical protein